MQSWLQSIKELKQYVYIDESNFLREKCRNEDFLDELISEGEDIIWDYSGADRMKICGALGNLYRLKGDIDTALPYLELYKDYCLEHEDIEVATLALLRYSEGLKYAKYYSDALENFKEVLKRCEIYNIDKYINYAWQHLGKCYMEMGDLLKAEYCFLKAFILRRKLNEPRLLEASTTVLNFMMKIKK